MNYYKDKVEGTVYAYDDEQMAIINRINAPDFDNGKEQILEIFFEINEKIKGMHEMSKKEVDAYLNPKPTKEQLIADAEQKKKLLIAEVNTETEMLRAKLALGRIKDDEKARLNEWLDYLEPLEVVDTSLAPDIDWPQKP